MDAPQLADFLRTRRESLRPEDVGLARGPRRRTPGLRREEVAQLAGMSSDYVNRLEQARGPQPSVQLLTALARALRLSDDERDHLFRLAGHPAPERAARSEHVAPGMLRLLDRLADTPAQVMTENSEVLVQTAPARALFGDLTTLTGLRRSTVYRWFADPASREIYPREDHPEHERVFVAELRAVAARQGPGSLGARIVDALLTESPAFRARWAEHDVAWRHPATKRFQHPELGTFTLDCRNLVDADTRQRLLVLTAEPGSADADTLELLRVLGTQSFAAHGAG